MAETIVQRGDDTTSLEGCDCAPPAVSAVSRCRARQHHDQAVTYATDAPIAGRMSQATGRNAAHCPGWSLQRQGHPKIVSNRSAETVLRTRS